MSNGQSNGQSYGNGYGEAFTDYEGGASGPSYPWIQVSPGGLFYADAEEAREEGTAAHFLASIKAKETEENDRAVLGLDSLLVNIIARRRRFLIADPRDGKTISIRSDYDAAEAEATRQRAKVRGHVQLLVLVSPPKGIELPPFPCMLTAKGIQSGNLWAAEKLIYERCVRPMERDGHKGIPPLAYTVQLGFGPKQTVGSYNFELRPVTLTAPANALTADKANSLIRIPADLTRRIYDDSRAWVAAWAKRDEAAAPASRPAQGRDTGRAAPPPAADDDIPF